VVRRFLDNSGLLVAGTALAVLWANLAHASYARAAFSLQFAVNDVAMAFFFALAAKEVVEATAPNGPLHSLRQSSLPLLAAVGGMAGPAIIYLALITLLGRPELARGWAIPCATDVAFSYLAARIIFGARHPAIPFLLLLAIADDALGLVVIALFYPSGIVRPWEFCGVLSVALGMAWWLRRRTTINFWPYILGPGVVSWFAFHLGGLHPALALVPIVPFLPSRSLIDFEHRWKWPVQIILFFFGLANAGVAFTSVGTVTWIVLAAIVAGKPIGIAGSTVLGSVFGLQKPVGVTWRDIAVLGTIAGIGFTVALFFATASFPAGPLLDQAKMGALLSFSSAGIAVVLARALRVNVTAAP
jgi:NhaA family Na+:H+ antiporter